MLSLGSIKTVRWYGKEPVEPIPVPVLGPDLMDPREYAEIKKYTHIKLAEQQAQPAEESAAAEPESAA
jgi:NADH-quinone oxidoreductase subunit B